MSRPLVASIDLTALGHNTRLAARSCPKICAIVKANAYGHGAIAVAHYMEKALSGIVQGFGVASLSEALELRHNNSQLPIVLLEGFFSQEEASMAQDYQLSPVIHSQWQLEHVLAQWKPRHLPVWVKINTGMTRLGFAEQQIPQVSQQLKSAGIDCLLMSHYASADSDNSMTLRQYQRFQQHGENHTTSIGNSAAVLYHSAMVGDIARPGIMLYGATPDNSDPAIAGLQPVMKLHSQLIAINQVTAGDTVGYGTTWTAQKNGRIGIVACGYADGYPREIDQQAYACIDGIKCPIVGRVSMDMLALDLYNCPQATIGSEVVLWGDDPLVTQVAQWSHTIAYTLLTHINRRVRMSYIRSAD